MFVQQAHRCVLKGSRVFVPTFAIGRLQEICLMLNNSWERTDCTQPIELPSVIGAKATDVDKQESVNFNVEQSPESNSDADLRPSSKDGYGDRVTCWFWAQLVTGRFISFPPIAFAVNTASPDHFLLRRFHSSGNSG
jgi:Cft2 family RNA processing exonuclease